LALHKPDICPDGNVLLLLRRKPHISKLPLRHPLASMRCLSPTLGTGTVKVKLMPSDIVICRLGNLTDKFLGINTMKIVNPPTAHTAYMGVSFSIRIIAKTILTSIQHLNKPDFPQDFDGFVNSRQTHCRVKRLKLIKNHLGTWMRRSVCEHTIDRKPLWGYFKPLVSK
jgi:hypothetical protein